MSSMPSTNPALAEAAPPPRGAERVVLRIALQSDAEMPAVRRFNARMRAAQAPTDFLLPDRPNTPLPPGQAPPLVSWTKYVVLDNEEEARGGFLLMTQPAWLNGNLVNVANYQAPLSEGIADPRFAIASLHMLRYVQRQWPLAFVVGMGDIERPLPRLLTAASWTVRPIPWLFRMLRPGRVMREIQMLQRRTPVRIAARIAAASGAAWLGAQALHVRRWPARTNARAFTLDRVDEWGDWADDVWRRTREDIGFAVVRDRRTLESLYPAADPRNLIYVLRRGADVAGWAVCVDTQMQEHSHFGNLRVATVLDALALPSSMPSLASRLSEALSDSGADLLMTNQSHTTAVDAFRRAGFAVGPSNYLFAASKDLTREIGARKDRVHVTRGDGDGRIHL